MNKKEITLFNEKEEKIFSGKITSLVINEELIIKKSIEYFNDDSPCFIHRSAIMKKLFIELEDYLEDGVKDGKKEWMWDEFPESIKNILNNRRKVNRIMYA